MSLPTKMEGTREVIDGDALAENKQRIKLTVSIGSEEWVLDVMPHEVDREPMHSIDKIMKDMAQDWVLEHLHVRYEVVDAA